MPTRAAAPCGVACYPGCVLRVLARPLVQARCVILALGLLGAGLVAPIALAQDDWDITRDSRPQTTPRRTPRAPHNTGPTPAIDRAPMMERYLGVLAHDADQPFALQRLLDLYRQRDGNLDRLVVDLEERIARGRSAYDYLVVLGDVERARNQIEGARAAYDRAIALAPDRPSALRAMGMLLIDQQKPRDAHAMLERAVAASKNGEAKQQLLRTLAELALDAHDYDNAARYFSRLSEGGGVYLVAEYARALTAKGEHSRAVEEYQRVLARLRGDPRVLAPVLIELAKAQLAADQADAAIATLGHARKVSRSSGLGAEIDATLLDAYRRAGRLPELAQDLSRRAGTHETHVLLGRVWDEIGDSAQALIAYRRALATRPNAIDVRMAVVALLSRDGRLSEVIEEYRALVRTAPQEPRFVIELAQLLMETGKRAEAMSMLASVSARHPRDARLHEALAQLYTRWNEHERAADELALLTRIAPDDPMHWVVLGEEQMARGNRDAALATWRRILHVSDAPAKAHVTLGELMVDHDMLQEAITEYREALKLDENDLEATRGLAEALERSRRDQEATTQWLRVMELSASDRALRREARRRLIAIWARTNQLRERLAQYARQFSITGEAQANDTEAGRFLAEGYERLARDRAPQSVHFRGLAEQVLRRIVELEPGDTEALTALEQILASRGDLEGAIAMLERLLLADPPRARSYLAKMATHALQLYRDDQAIAYAERSVALNSDDAQAHQRLGELYRARQNIDAAIASFERAVKLNERLFDVYFALAELHLARGHAADADRHLRQVMRACPDDDLVARAARASIQLHLGDNSLATLEAELLPLALGHPQRPIYRRLVIELYDAVTQPWTSAGGTDQPAQAALAKRALKPLLEALSDQDPEQRRTAVRILSQLHHPGAAAPLLALAESDTDMDVRRGALLSVGWVATEDLAPRLAAIAAGPHRRLRDVAAWALARMGGRSALNELHKMLDSSLPVVRTYAVLGLGGTEQAREVPTIAALLRNDRSPMVRSAAALALARLGGAEASQALVASLRGHDDQAASSAIVALGIVADEQAAPALADTLFVQDNALQQRALWALMRLGRGSELGAVDLIHPPTLAGDAELWSPDLGGMQWSILNDIAARFPDALLAGISGALHGTREVMLLTMQALLSALPPTRAPESDKASLVTLLRSVDGELTKLVRHPDHQVRAVGFALLSRIGSPAAADLLDAALHDPDASVRAAALASVQDATPAPASGRLTQVIEMARHADAWSMRLQAIDALGRFENHDGCTALIDALTSDAYAYVREQAAHWVGARCAQAGTTALMQARDNDPEPRVRAAARAALTAP